MYYVYLIKSEASNKVYIGYSIDLKRRFQEHNNGDCKSTKSERPWKLIYYEAYSTAKLALTREKQLKRFAKSYAMLKKRICL